ncbi:MAG: PTS sugar transporter subunit IIA [Pirellulales bacterium]|nr:PTS sugar transporter subunit IIA [Planctomycetales bacterium]
MAQDDFDALSLAQYLHLSREQVLKMADRGRLPGRKVGGEWRFSSAEVHHWLEEKIGARDDDQLAALEAQLHDESATDDQDHSYATLAELIPLEAIAIPLDARTKTSTIDAIVELAMTTGWLWDPAKLAEAVRQREDLHPTSLDNGVALLHPRRPMSGILERPFIALGRTPRGIPFGGPTLTDLFFLICSTDDRGHLVALARLSRMLGTGEYLQNLRAATDAREAYELIQAFDAEVSS